ncbi:hypothetical protein HBI18_216030 [Parastagonospora nodorum]|nr:hypothetical protein HBI18_216030 [Parastagonospora nodorum]
MRSGVALPPVKRAQPLSQTQESIKKLRTMQSATLPSLSQETILQLNSQDLRTQKRQTRELVQPKHETPLLVRSSIATTPCRSAAYKFQFLSANMIALIGTVLYNAIKEYHNDETRKIIYFHSYTVETIHANYIKNSRSNVTVPDDYHDNDVNNILIKYIDDKQQRYNTLIEDYNRAEKREDNILTIDKCRTREIHNILLREFRKANDFTESITHNDDKQELELEDYDALVERYEEEINCSNLYSTM